MKIESENISDIVCFGYKEKWINIQEHEGETVITLAIAIIYIIIFSLFVIAKDE